MLNRLGILGVLLPLCVGASWLEAEDSRRLSPIVVTASRLEQALLDSSASMSVVERDDIRFAQPTVGLDEPLRRVPGVFVQNSGNFAQDFRVQIRGFGTRSAFGVREVRVLVDGLPETLPDGQTQLDGIELSAVERIEILRGAASSLYGNASGGVIHFFTEDAPDVPSGRMRFAAGSNGLQKYDASAGARSGQFSLIANGSYHEQSGYRDHSRARSGNIRARFGFEPSERMTIKLIVDAIASPQADDPGALTRTESHERPRQARMLNVDQDAGEEIHQQRVGLTLRYVGDVGDLEGYGYILYRDFENRLPIIREGDGVVTFHRLSPGGGLRYSRYLEMGRLTSRFTLGSDVQYQDDRRRRYTNNAGIRGDLGLQQREQVTGLGPYLNVSIDLGSGWEANGGARFDHIDFSVDTHYPAAPSGTRTFQQWSPSGGLRYRWSPNVAFFASAGTAFQVPTTTELANPAGSGFNANLDPQRALEIELGAHAIFGSYLRAGITAFWIGLTDELVPFELGGRTYFRNAGRSERLGVELDWEAEVVRNLRWSSALTVINSEYRSYSAAGEIYDGNEEPGIPPVRVFQELRYKHPAGVFVGFEALLVEPYFVDDANSEDARAYQFLGARMGLERRWGSWTVAPFIGVQNLLDQNYDGTVRLNAVGGRFFEPAAGVSAFGGIAVSAHL